MPFNVGDAINSAADRITNNKFIDAVSRNPIYSALAMSVMITLIIIFIYRDVDFGDADTTASSLHLRGGFYIFLFLTGALFLHDRILMSETSDNKTQSEVSSVFGAGDMRFGAFEDSIVPVNANRSGGSTTYGSTFL